MKIVVYGAGAIGSIIGARLFNRGVDVTLIARGDHAGKIKKNGLTFIDPQGRQQIPIPVVEHPEDITFSAEDVVFLTMKSQDTPAALQALAACCDPQAAIVCAQNGVANEAVALRFFPHVYGMAVNIPGVFLHSGEVATHGDGRDGPLDLGRYPSGVDERSRTIATMLTAAGFSSKVDKKIMRWKYGKLLVNLGNALDGVILKKGEDNAEITSQLVEEALVCYQAAGIDYATPIEGMARMENCDYRLGSIEGYEFTNSTRQSLERRMGNIETDYFNGEVVQLGRTYNIPIPVNELIQCLAREIASGQRDRGSFTSDQLFAQLQ